jgi:hypothetical protein
VLHTFNVKEFYTTIGLIMYVVVETCHAVGIVENQIAHDFVQLWKFVVVFPWQLLQQDT